MKKSNLYHNYYFHQETQMDVGALALQIAIAVAVSVATAGAGAALMASVVMSTALATTAATAALIAVGTQYGISAAMSGGEHGTEQIQSGDADSTTTRSSTLITSSLLFDGDLTLGAGGNANTQTANIKADNITQEVKQSSTTSQISTHTDIEPDYGSIAKGAAVTGFIAGVATVGGEYIKNATGAKAGTQGVTKDGAVYKPSENLVKDVTNNPAKYSLEQRNLIAEYSKTGVIDKSAYNVGMANTTDVIENVGSKANPAWYAQGNEGSLLMRTVEKADKDCLLPKIGCNVKEKSVIITDSYHAYNDLRNNYKHKSVKHSANEYVRNEIDLDGRVAFKVHTNTVEGFWSLVKRTINGTHHWISKKHTNKYLAEMTMRYNSRETSEGLRLNDIMSNLNGRLSYKQLVAKV